MTFLKVLIFLMPFLAATNAQAQIEWQTSRETYNGEQYVIEKNKYLHSITNEKYDFTPNATCDIELEGETSEQMNQRRMPLCKQVYDVADKVFQFDSIPVKWVPFNELILLCFFNSQTKDYAGVNFIFNVKLEEYITLEKLNLLEQELAKAGLNAGTTNLLDDDIYFLVEVHIPIGEKE